MAKGDNITKTTSSGTKVMSCECINDYQDKKYGKSMRVHNPTAKGFR